MIQTIFKNTSLCKRIVIKTASVFIIAIMLFFVSGCQNKLVSESELMSYLLNEKNGLLQDANSNRLHYKLLYKPKELLFPESHFTQNLVPKGVHYFQLTIETLEQEEVYTLANTPEEIEEINQLLNFEIGAYLQLITSQNDTIIPSAIQYNQALSMGHSTDLLICFETEELLESKTFSIELNKPLPIDNQLSAFHFQTKYIKKIPKLKKDEEQ